MVETPLTVRVPRGVGVGVGVGRLALARAAAEALGVPRVWWVSAPRADSRGGLVVDVGAGPHAHPHPAHPPRRRAVAIDPAAEADRMLRGAAAG